MSAGAILKGLLAIVKPEAGFELDYGFELI
jgi:hypothetical protein